MDIRLDGKVALVTGGTKGIGKAIVAALSESGAQVVIHGNSSIDDAYSWSEKLSNISFYKADLSDNNQTSKVIESVIELNGKLDILVNNAGISIDSPPTLDNKEWISDWTKTMQVNLTAVGILCKNAIEHFMTQKGGVIINISSRAAFRGDIKEYMAYAASKGGMVALTRSIARAYGKNDITAFNVAPGFTRTEMAQQFIDQYGEEIASSDIALNKLTTPEDIAPLIVFLSSGLAAHSTGGTFDVNAGSYVH